MSKACVTTVTTVTRKRQIPPLGVARMVCTGARPLSRNSARGDTSESGYSGYSGYEELDKESVGGPGAWALTHRHVDERLN